MTVSFSCGLFFLACSTVILATNGGIRKMLIPKIDCVTFMIVFCISRFMFAFCVWLYAGMPGIDSLSGFNSVINALFLMLGGFTSVLGNSLYFTCTKNISVSSTQAVSSSAQILFGVTVNYFISHTDVNEKYLIIGNFLSLVGLALVIIVDGLKAQAAVTKSDSTGAIVNSKTKLIASTCTDSPVINYSYKSVEDYDSLEGQKKESQNPRRVRKPITTTACHIDDDDDDDEFESDKMSTAAWVQWLLRAMIAGVLFTGFSVFANYESSRENPIMNGALVNLFFHLGFLISMPIAIYLFYHKNILGNMGCEVKSMDDLFSSMKNTSYYELLGSFFIGCLTSCALTLFYYAIDIVPDTVSYALLCSQPIVATLSSIFLFQDLNMTIEYTLKMKTMLILAFVVYATSLFILVNFAMN